MRCTEVGSLLQIGFRRLGGLQEACRFTAVGGLKRVVGGLACSLESS